MQDIVSFVNSEKIKISNFPLFQSLEKVPYKQLLNIGSLYTYSSLEWSQDKPKLLPKILEGIKLKKEDVKDLLSLLEIPTEEEKVISPPLGRILNFLKDRIICMQNRRRLQMDWYHVLSCSHFNK
jgi:hypothetical protein